MYNDTRNYTDRYWNAARRFLHDDLVAHLRGKRVRVIKLGRIVHSVHRGQKPGNFVKAVERLRVHRPRTTHDSSCRYIRDGYYCCCCCRCCKPITIAILRVYLSSLSLLSLSPISFYTPLPCLPMTTPYPSSAIDFARFSLVPIYLSFPLAKEVTGYLAAVDRDLSREIYVLCYEGVRVTISSRC